MELKPCPWCGDKQPMEPFDRGGIWFAGHCPACDTSGPPGLTKAEAIAAWNSRAQQEAVAKLTWLSDGTPMWTTYPEAMAALKWRDCELTPLAAIKEGAE